MEAPIQPNSTETQPKDEGNIIGEVILGKVDPRTLSEEQFLALPDLLFHGAAQPFVYSPNGEYDMLNTGGDGTRDYGEGLYTTDNRVQAENYSKVRGGSRLAEPLVYSFLPLHARMLDVRDKTNPDYIGLLPRSFVEQWLQFLNDYLLDENTFARIGKKKESTPPPKPATGMERWDKFFKERVMGQPKKPQPVSFQDRLKRYARQDFLDRVQKALDEGKPILIRTTGGRPGIFDWGNGVIGIAFQKFMRSQGYDGMIYREGGEGEGREDITGYVFYNPEVVDTYEGWKKRAKENS